MCILNNILHYLALYKIKLPAAGTLRSRAAKWGNPFPPAPRMGEDPQTPLRKGQAPSFSLWYLRHQINKLQIWCLRHQKSIHHNIYTRIFFGLKSIQNIQVYVYTRKIYMYTRILYTFFNKVYMEGWTKELLACGDFMQRSKWQYYYVSKEVSAR